MEICLKRVYDPASPADGYRVLVDRLWPRGRKKEDLPYGLWLKEAAPSPRLRRWFGHHPKRWKAFRVCYQEELRSHIDLLAPLREVLRTMRVTLLYAARDPEHNHAVVLREFLLSDLANTGKQP